MKSIFAAKLNARVRPNDILVKTRKSATFGEKSLARSGPKNLECFTTKHKSRKLLC